YVMEMAHMSARTLFSAGLMVLAISISPVLAENVVFSLTSPQSAMEVAAGATINWQITAEITSGGSAGLSLVAVDLLQDGANPESLDLPPADGVPTEFAGFSRPAGISNPGEGGATTGYIGVQRGNPGALNLVQIGGAQNSTGVGAAAIGTDTSLEGGLGLSGPVVIAQGSFAAPATEGTYSFQLANALANTLDSIQVAPTPSPVSKATTSFAAGSFSFTVVASTQNLGDMNCDGFVDDADIGAFALAMVDAGEYGAAFPACDINLADMNQDTFKDGLDIAGFVDALLAP
ncbi:MAG: hypothetical protein KDA33_07175, partial [Phycisphaerales bacterium]|nr:hypothetical protein [Phycisphaerales bacterium]